MHARLQHVHFYTILSRTETSILCRNICLINYTWPEWNSRPSVCVANIIATSLQVLLEQCTPNLMWSTLTVLRGAPLPLKSETYMSRLHGKLIAAGFEPTQLVLELEATPLDQSGELCLVHMWTCNKLEGYLQPQRKFTPRERLCATHDKQEPLLWIKPRTFSSQD